MKQNRIRQGFTLVEVLVAIALFGILLAVLVSSITALLGINRKSEQQLSSATQAQQVLENIKGAWQPATTQGMNDTQRKEAITQAALRFDANCVLALSLPTGVTAKSQELDLRAGEISGKSFVDITSTCPSSAPASGPVMRRVQVVAGTGAQTTTLTLDLLEPQ